MKYFRLEEFICRCGCGENNMDENFLRLIDLAREIAGVPFIINSGFRCQKHNKEVGSSSQNHPSGRAVDIKATDGYTRGKILKGLYKAGFKRVGIRGDFLHADTMDKHENCWLY